jgi:hypothetical protein
MWLDHAVKVTLKEHIPSCLAPKFAYSIHLRPSSGSHSSCSFSKARTFSDKSHVFLIHRHPDTAQVRIYKTRAR